MKSQNWPSISRNELVVVRSSVFAAELQSLVHLIGLVPSTIYDATLGGFLLHWFLRVCQSHKVFPIEKGTTCAGGRRSNERRLGYRRTMTSHLEAPSLASGRRVPSILPSDADYRIAWSSMKG